MRPASIIDRAARAMTAVITRTAVPVELLRDQRGVYGIGVCELFDFEAVAWSCGIEPEPHTFEGPRPLILRPDRLLGTRPRGAVLQKITGGFRRGPFMCSHEEQLRKFIHHEALNRAGLRWPPRRLQTDAAWWSADKKQQQRNRGIYHGLRLRSLHVINQLIGVALEAASDADAIRLRGALPSGTARASTAPRSAGAYCSWPTRSRSWRSRSTRMITRRCAISISGNGKPNGRTCPRVGTLRPISSSVGRGCGMLLR